MQDFEDSCWDEHFAPRTAYKWRHKLGSFFLPSFNAHNNAITDSSNILYEIGEDEEDIACVPNYVFVLCSVSCTLTALVVGLSLVGHYQVPQPCSCHATA